MRSVRFTAWLAVVVLTTLGIAETYGEEGEKKPASAEKQFKQRDKDEDGFLSLEEFKSAIKKEEMKEQADKWFKNRDKDGDGKLSFEEFEAGKNQKKKTD
jgi:Ca2+-binding EF-hand superfamily protein